MYRVSHFVRHFAFCLLAGLALAMLWVNLAPESYFDFIEYRLADAPFVGYPDPSADFGANRTLTIGYLSGGVLMAFFFLLAGKELWEAIILPTGSLRGRKAITPLAATLGGMAGAALVYLAFSAIAGSGAVPVRGWVVPLASDVALCYLVGRAVFGARHPALRFLLLLTLTSDFYALLLAGSGPPAGMRSLVWLLLPLGAGLIAFLLFNRLPRFLHRDDRVTRRPGAGPLAALPFLLAGVISWYGVQQAGFHPALGLLPIVPAIPHANHAYGLFAEVEELLHDLLNRIAHALVYPVCAALFLFGLTHGGAEIVAAGPVTLAVLAAVWLGKPAGVILGALFGARVLGAGFPIGMGKRDLLIAATITATSATVPLLAVPTALPGGEVAEAARLGIVCGLAALPAALVLLRLWPWLLRRKIA
ncbi:MAG: Na+/H+ antiporter NhaA [Paracoccaceae bacterium]